MNLKSVGLAVCILLANLSLVFGAGVPYVSQFPNGNVPGPNGFTNLNNIFYGTFVGTNLGTLTLKNFGAIGDGSHDDTAAVKAAALSGQTVLVQTIGSGYLIATNIVFTNNTAFVGDGSAKFIFKTGTVGAMLSTSNANNVRISGLVLYGGDVPLGPPTGNGRTGLTLWSGTNGTSTGNPIVQDLYVQNFSDYGIRYSASDPAGPYNTKHAAIFRCKSYQCGAGFQAISLDNFSKTSEFSDFLLCEADSCWRGFEVSAGNLKFNQCFVTRNTEGINITGSGSINDNHGLWANCEFAHNITDVIGANVTLGELFTGCSFHVGGVVLNNCQGVTFQGCEFQLLTNFGSYTLTSTNGGFNFIKNCYFLGAYFTNLAAITVGTNWVLQNNISLNTYGANGLPDTDGTTGFFQNAAGQWIQYPSVLGNISVGNVSNLWHVITPEMFATNDIGSGTVRAAYALQAAQDFVDANSTNGQPYQIMAAPRVLYLCESNINWRNFANWKGRWSQSSPIRNGNTNVPTIMFTNGNGFVQLPATSGSQSVSGCLFDGLYLNTTNNNDLTPRNLISGSIAFCMGFSNSVNTVEASQRPKIQNCTVVGYDIGLLGTNVDSLVLFNNYFFRCTNGIFVNQLNGGTCQAYTFVGNDTETFGTGIICNGTSGSMTGQDSSLLNSGLSDMVVSNGARWDVIKPNMEGGQPTFFVDNAILHVQGGECANNGASGIASVTNAGIAQLDGEIVFGTDSNGIGAKICALGAGNECKADYIYGSCPVKLTNAALGLTYSAYTSRTPAFHRISASSIALGAGTIPNEILPDQSVATSNLLFNSSGTYSFGALMHLISVNGGNDKSIAFGNTAGGGVNGPNDTIIFYDDPATHLAARVGINTGMRIPAAEFDLIGDERISGVAQTTNGIVWTTNSTAPTANYLTTPINPTNFARVTNIITANGSWWQGYISNSIQIAWRSNNVVNWKQIAP